MGVRNITTLNQYLQDRLWLFQEKGLIAVWNELKTIANSAIEGGSAAMPGGGVTTLGACVLTTNIAPDFAERAPNTGRANDAAGGTITEPPTQHI